jgi:chorismate mutase
MQGRFTEMSFTARQFAPARAALRSRCRALTTARHIAAVLACGLALTGSLAGARDDEGTAPQRNDVIALKDAIAARLLLADDVARYKWNHAQPVADPAREAIVLERTTSAAVALGIPYNYAQRVVAAQIAASRARQDALIASWRREGAAAFGDVPDLATAQRPALDRATTELLVQLKGALCALDDAARRTLDVPPQSFDESAHEWSIATDALWPPPTECRHP